jgi:hypothetical protein
VKEHLKAEAEKNKKAKLAKGVKKPAKIGGKVYLDLADEVENEERKNPSVSTLSACKFNDRPNKNTRFFSTYETTYLFSKLIEYFKDNHIKFALSEKYFKIDFEIETKADLEGEADEKTVASPQVCEKFLGVVEIQKVDDEMFCVDFTRKTGSAWLFYQKYNFMQADLAGLSDAYYEPIL